MAQIYPGISLAEVWSGRVSAGYVNVLVEQLNLNPDSRVRMINFGGDLRYIGWNVNAELLADQFDQLMNIVSGIGKSKVTDSILYPRPGKAAAASAEETVKPYAPTIADFNVGGFMSEVARS